jgi:hypothetical protein
MNAKAKKEAQAKVIARIDKELKAVQHEVRMNKQAINTLVEKQKVLKKERHELTQLLFSLNPQPSPGDGTHFFCVINDEIVQWG